MRQRIETHLSRASRQTDGNRRALAYPALDVQSAMMQLHDVLDDREAEAGSAQLARARAVNAIKPLRQPRNVRGRNALARIRDDHLDVRGTVAGRPTRHTRPQHHLAAARSVFDRVVDEVEEELMHLVAIDVNRR